MKEARSYRSTENLSHEGDASNLGTSQFETLETVLVRGTDGKLLLQVVGIHNGGESLLGVDGAVGVRQSSEGRLGLGELSLTHQVPGGLGCKAQQGNEPNGPEPLLLSESYVEG